MVSLDRLGISATLFFVGLFLFGAVSEGLAADAARIEKLILRLGSDNFREREAASKELAALREEALPALRKATQSKDAEVKRAAQAIVGSIEGKLAAEARAMVEAAGGKVRDASAEGLLSPTGLSVNLSGSRVSDDDLKCLKWLGRVEWVGLSQARVSAAGMAHLKGLTELRGLELDHASVSDAGLAHLEGLTELRELDLTGCRQVTDTGLASLKGLTKLTRLDLGFTQVTDKGLAHLSELESLTMLFLSGTRVEGHGLSHLKKLRQLRVLVLNRSRATGAGLAAVKELSGLESLALSPQPR